MFDWSAFEARLRAYPPHYHHILPPCTPDRIKVIERKLGRLPPALVGMLRRFNGAELFVSAIPAFTLFGVSTCPQPSAFEWAQGWYIDTYTPQWRETGRDREHDWALGMTSYGGLILLDETEIVSEWGTAEGEWLSRGVSLGDWTEKVIREGEEIMAEGEES